MTRIPIAALVVLAIGAGGARADEGMWTFDHFPSAAVKATYGVTIDQAWLDKVQRAAVRLTTGCSASVVSSQGLVLTNHHCVVECVQDNSTPQTDFVKSGFAAATREAERKCPGMQAEILESITDVTSQIRAVTSQAAPAAGFTRLRDSTASVIEAEACGKAPGYRCQVVGLYRGGQYRLYKYRKYSDVRLVFAPEFGAAFFGGDPDNFNFPRFNLDSAFIRLYENGKPVATPGHLPWNPKPPVAGDPVFVAGNPGGTDRLLTVAQLETQRDLVLPIGQLQRAELRGRLIRFSEEGAEHKRIATDPLFGVENSFKVFYDAVIMQAKRQAEAALRAKVAADPRLAAEIGDPWGEIAAAQKAYGELYLPYRQLETGAGGFSDLMHAARILVRAAQERGKPIAQRLPEYSDSALPLMQKTLLDDSPVDPELETLYLGFWLSKTREYLTTDDPNVKALLGRQSPEALAKALVDGSKLADPAVRKALWDGGLPAVEASTDPLIRFVLATDPDARRARSDWEARVSGPVDQAAERVARAQFAVYGDSIYPDATFTLRLSYGKIAGWTYRGRTIAPFTTFAGLYERATGAEPYELPPRWLAARERLTPTTVFNISTTNDIIGGNSGSPLIDAKGRVIGAVFDGNIHSLGGDYGYDGTLNRTIAVSTAAITEALGAVYGQTALVAELTHK